MKKNKNETLRAQEVSRARILSPRIVPPSDRFITQNLYQGAFCLCQGLRLSGKSTEGKKVSIIFEGQNAQEKAMTFYNGALVPAKAYSDAYRSLKDFIFER